MWLKKRPKSAKFILAPLEIYIMEAINTCLCCLLRPPDKDLSTPYPRLGSTEIYSDMMEYCFQIQLAGDEEGGICEECVGQLRDARDFRLQVECSVARLQAWREPWRPVAEASGCAPEAGADEASDGSLSHEEPPIELETDSEDELHSEMILEEPGEPPGKAETDSGDEAGGEILAGLCARGRRQLAMTCCVRLERAERRDHPRGDSSVAEPRRSFPQQSDETYICFLCKKRFTAMSDLVVHMTTHTGQTPYSCPVCFKMFAIQSHLTLHTKNHSKHRKQIHAIKNSYICDICKRKFRQKHYLAAHMRLHTGQNIHSCNVCDKLFTEKALLIEHMRGHTGEKPFVCTKCKKKFAERRSLQAHMQIHRGIIRTCYVCKLQFSQRNHLVRHMSTHTGRPPFTCDVCGKIFSVKLHCVEHKRIHTGEKPFSCEECNKRFISRGNLNRHLQSKLHTSHGL